MHAICKGRDKVVVVVPVRVPLWHIWKQRDARFFEDKSSNFLFFCNLKQKTVLGWIPLPTKKIATITCRLSMIGRLSVCVALIGGSPLPYP